MIIISQILFNITTGIFCQVGTCVPAKHSNLYINFLQSPQLHFNSLYMYPYSMLIHSLDSNHPVFFKRCFQRCQVKDNTFLDWFSRGNWGYPVFGKVVKGYDIAVKISKVPNIGAGVGNLLHILYMIYFRILSCRVF